MLPSSRRIGNEMRNTELHEIIWLTMPGLKLVCLAALSKLSCTMSRNRGSSSGVVGSERYRLQEASEQLGGGGGGVPKLAVMRLALWRNAMVHRLLASALFAARWSHRKGAGLTARVSVRVREHKSEQTAQRDTKSDCLPPGGVIAKAPASRPGSLVATALRTHANRRCVSSIPNETVRGVRTGGQGVACGALLSGLHSPPVRECRTRSTYLTTLPKKGRSSKKRLFEAALRRPHKIPSLGIPKLI